MAPGGTLGVPGCVTPPLAVGAGALVGISPEDVGELGLVVDAAGAFVVGLGSGVVEAPPDGVG